MAKDETMLTDYIDAAMRNAKFETLCDGTIYGEITGIQGVYANEDTLEQCHDELQSVLEGWIILGLELGHILPEIDGINISVKERVS